MTLDYPLEDASLGLVDSVVVDGGVAPAHEAVSIELPQLIPMTSPPLSIRIVRLVLEPDGDAVLGEAPEVLFQPVVELASPLAPEEGDDLLAALEELVAVAPLRVLGVGEGDLIGVAGVPSVLGRLDLLPGTLLSKWRHRRSYLLFLAALLHTVILLSASTVGCPFYPAPALSSAVVSHRTIIFPGRIARPAIGLSPVPPSPWRNRGPSGWCCRFVHWNRWSGPCEAHPRSRNSMQRSYNVWSRDLSTGQGYSSEGGLCPDLIHHVG